MDFEGFAGALAEACEKAAEGTLMLIAMDDPQPDDEFSVLVGEVGPDDLDDSLTAQLDQLVKDRKMLALATRVKWSPDESDTVPSWLLVAVTGEDEAIFAVKRMREDDRWWRMKGVDTPWFALSTASSLRASILNGEPLHLKQARDEALYKRVWENPHPPTDKHGRL